MRSWSLERASAGVAGAVLSTVVGEIGRPGFARAALVPLCDAFEVGSWAAYRLRPDAPPLLHLAASHNTADTTGACFAAYRDDGLYRHDTSFAPVLGARRCGQPMLLRMRAEEAPSEAHRDAIYRRHGMLERLTVARLDGDGSVLAVNVYRHRGRGLLEPAQVEGFADLAAALLAAVARHIEWADCTSTPAAGDRARLSRRCAALTGRELDVLERLLTGMTYDGIADDLGLSLASVKTYRARAFQRLGIHFRSQLPAAIRSDPVDLSDDSAGARQLRHSDSVPRRLPK